MARGVDSVSGAAALRAAGLRVTGPRLAVLAVLAESSHLPADAVTAGVRHRLGSVSAQAVYDVLRALTAAGLIRRVDSTGNRTLYDARASDNHHHLACRDCGAIVDVDCAVGDPPCLQPCNSAGFLVDEADVTYRGRCPDCQARSAPPGPPERSTAP